MNLSNHKYLMSAFDAVDGVPRQLSRAGILKVAMPPA